MSAVMSENYVRKLPSQLQLDLKNMTKMLAIIERDNTIS